MNRQNVTKWCRAFSEGRTDVHEEHRTVRPFVISGAILQRTEEAMQANRHLTLRELHKIIPEVSMATLHECVTVTSGYHKLCVLCLLHDNARPHTEHKTKALLKRLKWAVLDHPPYSSDLAPSDFHLFLYLKRHIPGQNFHDDDEIINEVEMWFQQQVVNFYDCGIQKLVPRLNKCLDNGGNFVEK
ncbi:Histone-lysine N-methyltransferase SETMAR [Araneus ventricosus]|uniref:Histone-lysine N-methyltransferase SETMAR n=1 Tax=Araneus ventricosus TaxID=182803 RepID=A0A4Y2F1B4_ARAVE|nr:Histone-lysine N-methyltransferase SETMAR [Araneus ventricosus]